MPWSRWSLVLLALFGWQAQAQADKGAFELTTDRLTLRPIRQDDLPAIVRIYGDEHLWEAQNYHLRREDFPVWPRALRYEPTQNLAHKFSAAILLRATGETVGFIGLSPVDGTSDEGEISFAIAVAKWRQGIVSEALPAFTKFCQERFHLRALIGETSGDNMGSKHVLAKNGFSFYQYIAFSDPHILRPGIQWERWRRTFPVRSSARPNSRP